MKKKKQIIETIENKMEQTSILMLNWITKTWFMNERIYTARYRARCARFILYSIDSLDEEMNRPVRTLVCVLSANLSRTNFVWFVLVGGDGGAKNLAILKRKTKYSRKLTIRTIIIKQEDTGISKIGEGARRGKEEFKKKDVSGLFGWSVRKCVHTHAYMIWSI